MDALLYEMLIRRAFGLKEGHMLERCGDPATLANTDQFTEDNLAAVKVGAGYAFEIMTTHIINNIGIGRLGDAEWERLEGFTARIVSARNLLEVNSIIEEFVATVEDRYFRFDDGVMSLKG